jgi:AcrR family transcriptional regulator
MTGLRERQKADRQRRLIEAALRLFRDKPYAAVRTEDIAAAAEVSVGTLYNYFATKGDLLLALVTMEVEEVLADGAGVVATPPDDIAQAFDALIAVYYDHSLVYLTKALWRTAMALSIEAPDTPFSARYTALDRSLIAQVTALVAELQRRGLARGDIPADQIGAILFNTLNQLFIEFVKVEPMTVADLKAQSAAQTAVLARMLAQTTASAIESGRPDAQGMGTLAAN